VQSRGLGVGLVTANALVARRQVGGLYHRYERHAAAWNRQDSQALKVRPTFASELRSLHTFGFAQSRHALNPLPQLIGRSVSFCGIAWTECLCKVSLATDKHHTCNTAITYLRRSVTAAVQ